MQKSKSVQKQEIEALINGGIKFLVCENSLKRKNLKKEEMIDNSGFVPVGIAHLAERQEIGYSYIKAGN